MFQTSVGTKIQAEELIMPLVTFDPAKAEWRCVGTGFFIQPLGGFVTAKHVFQNNDGTDLATLYGIQTLSNNERHVRPVVDINYHPNADICIGMLGKRRLSDGSDLPASIAPAFSLDLRQLPIGDSIKTFAFPLTKTEYLEENKAEFTFQGKWSTGKIEDFHEQGFSLLKNRCYQTSMHIDHGASGGPVLRNNLVIGVNSTGYQLAEEDGPLSFITPIDYLLEMTVKNPDGSFTSVIDLMKDDSINVQHFPK